MLEDGSAGVVQAAVMSAISVLEVQFDNNVQFLPESKISLPPAFRFREEQPAAVNGRKSLCRFQRRSSNNGLFGC